MQDRSTPQTCDNLLKHAGASSADPGHLHDLEMPLMETCEQEGRFLLYESFSDSQQSRGVFVFPP